FGKASGLGDIEIISSPAPIEIGNRVWFDANGNGIQDADENGIAGVTVQLRQGATVIATATTDASGNYYFSSDASRSSTGSAIYNISQLQP
ncbi:SdrD B-like domain-containing protein, partial [Acinetobacter baumannii]